MEVIMDSLERLRILSGDMDLEPAEDLGCPKISSTQQRPNKYHDPVVSEAIMPNGKRIRMLKTLLTSACERNCFYCPFRAGRNFHRATLKPDEMARVFMGMHSAGLVQGMFLSSGIAGGGVRTQDKILDTAEILRHKQGFRGYLHLKLMPGAEKAQVERAMQIADRVSINLEAPNALRLEGLAPRKTFLEELLQPLRWVQEIRHTQSARYTWNQRWPSSTTQFVVGAAGESDLELLKTTFYLYKKLGLKRAYYSPFRPISDTPLENLPPESSKREQRLYQASFLLRDYGFSLEDLSLDEDGRLPLNRDPKLIWAEKNLAEHPMEINRANQTELLHIPGIGPRGVRVIMDARKSGALRQLDDLTKIGVNASRAAPYILLNGHRPSLQLSLW
jgi:predicted DNA-binding helix-hairpin-helix protein